MSQRVERCKASELAAMLKDPDKATSVCVIDVRDGDFNAGGHIVNACNIPSTAFEEENGGTFEGKHSHREPSLRDTRRGP